MTMRPDTAIAHLRQVRAAAEAGEPIPADVAEWLAEAINRYEAEASTGLALNARSACHLEPAAMRGGPSRPGSGAIARSELCGSDITRIVAVGCS